MNLDERIAQIGNWCSESSNEWPDPMHCHRCGVGSDQIKQFIRDVVDYVKPDCLIKAPSRHHRHYESGHDAAVGEMEAKVRELGL